MTDSEANEIDVANENNVNTLRDLVFFWQNKAIDTQKKLSDLQKPSADDLKKIFS